MAWYKTNIDGDKSKAIIDVDKLAESLPHGSGIDGDWHILVQKNGNVLVTGEYHHMNEGGYYDGWSTFSFRFFKAPKDDIHPLCGPCAGQVQILARKGDIMWSGVRGLRSSMDREYMDDAMYDCVMAFLTRRNEIINSK